MPTYAAHTTASLRIVDPATVTHLGPLSRVRGGTYSSTVDTVRFVDGSTAHTDIIRLNPGLDTYSLDIDGISPRRLAHYRPGAAYELPDEVSTILLHAYPHVPLSVLRQVLDLPSLREHEAIAGTQAAIWHHTNGTRLDTRPVTVPVDRWAAILEPGRHAHLALDLVDAALLRDYRLRLGARTGRHELTVALEQSVDDKVWRPVSGSTLRIGAAAPRGGEIVKPLGHGATLASTRAGVDVGHLHYRLSVTGPTDRTGYVELRDIVANVSGVRRSRNSEGVMAVHDHLLALAETVTAPVDRHVVQPLVGSSVPDGPAEFTTVAAVVPAVSRSTSQVTQVRIA